MGSEICGIPQVVIPSNKQLMNGSSLVPCGGSHSELYCTNLAASMNRQFHFLEQKLHGGKDNHLPM